MYEIRNYISPCNEKFFNGNFARKYDEMLLNSRYANIVLLAKKVYRSNSRSISVLPIAHFLKFLCCFGDNIIAQYEVQL